MRLVVPLALSLLTTAVPTATAAKLRVPQDHATIQAAIDAAGANDVVEVSAGTYNENLSIAKSDLTIRAKGNDKVIVDGGGTGVLLGFAFAGNVTVQNLRFRNTADSVGIGAALSSNILLDGCRLENVPNDNGIDISVATVEVRDCRVKDVGGDGVLVNGNLCRITGTRIQDVGGAGVAVTGDLVTIDGNEIIRPGSHGIRLGDNATGATSCLVVDNDIEDAGGEGILCDNDATGNTLIDNVVDGAVFDGIELRTSAASTILHGNTVRNVADIGIEVDATDVIISKNKVKACGTQGVHVEANATDCVVHKNTTKQNTNDGLVIDGLGNLFTGNKGKNNVDFDLTDNTSPGDNVFFNNTFTTSR